MHTNSELLMWASDVFKTRHDECFCHRDRPINEWYSEKDLEKILSDMLPDEAEWFKNRNLYAAWNRRCPVHGFEPGSKEYNGTHMEWIDESKWYERWNTLKSN